MRTTGHENLVNATLRRAPLCFLTLGLCGCPGKTEPGHGLRRTVWVLDLGARFPAR